MAPAVRARAAETATRDATDSELVRRCLNRDEDAWIEIIDRYGRLVEAVIRRYHLPIEDRGDVFQDVWIVLWRELGKVKNQERLGPWLVTVAGRLAWDARKQLQRNGQAGSVDDLLYEVRDESINLEQQTIQLETSALTHAALARVSPRCRALVQALFFEQDVSYAELAARLGCSPNSIGPIRNRCLKELRDALSQE